MKFGQVFEYNKRNIFLEKSWRKCDRETSSKSLFFNKALFEVKASGAALFQYISIVLNLAYSKNKLYRTLDYWSRDMLNFDFLKQGLGIVSPAHFLNDFSRKMLLVLYSINWLNFFVPLSFFSRYWSTCVLKLFLDQVVTSSILKWALSF